MTKLLYFAYYLERVTGIRPTNVDEEIYIRFVNKCRLERKRVGQVLEKLMSAYIEKGDKLFKMLP